MRIEGIGALLALATVLPLVTPGAVVDRVAITVGSKVITESEIVRRIRLTAFQNGEKPDFDLSSRRAAALRLIDLKLVEREMELGHYVRTPPDRAKALLDAFTAEHYRSSPDALRISLTGAQLTPEDLRDELAEQADLLTFLNLRFRPAVEVSDQEVEKYFHEEIEAKNPGTPVALGDVRSNIMQILTAQKADRDLDSWLNDQRAHTRINYLIGELR